MNEITERRGLVGLPNGEVAAVQLIPWGDGQQGVMFTYENGHKIALPIEREQGSPNERRTVQSALANHYER